MGKNRKTQVGLWLFSKKSSYDAGKAFDKNILTVMVIFQ